VEMGYQKQLLLQNAQSFNILPVTSICNTSCIFCSHKQNPTSVQTYRFGNLSIEDIELILPFLDDNRKIFIGESATRLIEGEPFCNPDFKEILCKLRKMYPDTSLSITTNGSLLDQEWFKFLADIKPLEINYSINCINANLRKTIMGMDKSNNPKYVLENLGKHSIKYHGSLVAMNWLTGWEDMEETVSLAEKNAGSTMRIFLPGYTKLASEKIRFQEGYLQELKYNVQRLRSIYTIPITLEPPLLTTLNPQVVGVIKNSPADIYGVSKEDIIKEVDGINLLTRVDAFNLIKKKKNPKLKIERNGSEVYVEMKKEQGEMSGLVMDYDVESSLKKDIKRVSNKYRMGRTWILASKLGAPILNELIKGIDANIEIVQTESVFFGGSIMSAGLLTVQDFLTTFERTKNEVTSYDVLVVPSIAFDHLGRDLVGKFYGEIEAETGVKTITL